MRKLATAAVLVLALADAAFASGFRSYPGFRNFETPVEMVHDRGLTLEIVLRCGVKPNGKISPGIMSYSKVERLFCTPRGRCTRDVERAVRQTCGA